MKLRRWIIPALVVLSLGVTAIALLRPRGPSGTPVLVTTALFETFQRSVSATGSVKAEVSRTLSFAVQGNVSEVLVRVGDTVKAEQLLGRLDTSAARRDLDSARASLVAARADLAAAQTTVQSAALDLDRQVGTGQVATDSALAALGSAENDLLVQRRLYALGGLSRQELTKAQLARDDAARKLESARLDLKYAQQKRNSPATSAVAQSRAALELARVKVRALEASLQDAELRAPLGGVISAVKVTVGNPTAVGGAFELTDPARLYVEVPFDETRAAELRPGQPAEITFDALPSSPVKSRVTRIDPTAARDSSQVASVLARIRLPTASGARPGYTATAKVITRSLPGAVTVPLETVAAAEGTRAEDTGLVYRINPGKQAATAPGGTGRSSGTLEAVKVTVVARNTSRAVLTGIAAGDILLSNPDADSKTGVAVIYTPPKAVSRPKSEQPASEKAKTP
jgi:HlyD family secretion protein